MLKINGLISGYGSVQILNGANMKVDAQSIVALLGGNGTGKSTILKACSGLIRTWSGSINFNGEDIHNDPPHRIVEKGLVQVTQGKDVFPAMSVKENLKLGGFVLKSNQKLQDNLESLNRVFCSGEALTIDHRSQLLDVLSVQLHNLYGPTESGEISSYDCSQDEGCIGVILPIGKPINNSQFLLTHLIKDF